MSKESLPEKINPFRFAENALRLQGFYLIKDLSRLTPSLSNDEGEVQIDLTFGVDRQGIRYMKGHLETQLNLQCQRCMQPFIYGIMCDFTFGVVRTEEEAEMLPKQYDPIVVSKEALLLLDMVEDELIINLPLIPMHPPEACKIKLPLKAKLESGSDDGRNNPFKVIESLRTKRH